MQRILRSQYLQPWCQRSGHNKYTWFVIRFVPETRWKDYLGCSVSTLLKNEVKVDQSQKHVYFIEALESLQQRVIKLRSWKLTCWCTTGGLLCRYIFRFLIFLRKKSKMFEIFISFIFREPKFWKSEIAMLYATNPLSIYKRNLQIGGEL